MNQVRPEVVPVMLEVVSVVSLIVPLSVQLAANSMSAVMQMRVESRVQICRMVVLLPIQWGGLTRRGLHYSI